MYIKKYYKADLPCSCVVPIALFHHALVPADKYMIIAIIALIIIIIMLIITILYCLKVKNAKINHLSSKHKELKQEIKQNKNMMLQAKISSYKWNLQKKLFISHTDDNILKEDSFINAITPEQQSNFIELRRRIVTKTNQEVERLLFSIYSDNVINWEQSYICVIEKNSSGEPIFCDIVCIDVTERLKLMEGYKREKEKAEASDKIKSAFLQNLSHEIRTPLNSIIGFSDILGTIDDKEEKKNYITIIHENNLILLHLIEDILDIAKTDAGELEFHYSLTSLNNIFLEAEQSAKQIERAEVKIIYEQSDNKIVINTDRDRLLQVINYLLANAEKFTKSGNIKFGYRVLDSNFIYVFVSDTGCGIDRKNYQIIFDRFVKLNPFQMGTGLGLTICKSIINKMGGDIGVSSKVGIGSTFWFTIPVKQQ